MRIKTLLKLSIGIILLIVLIHYAGLNNIFEKLSQFNLLKASLILLILPLVLILSATNIWLLVKAINFKIKFKNMFFYSIISWAYGLFSPLKIGEFALVYYMKKEDVSLGQGLVISLIDRFITMFFLFIIACISVIKFFNGEYLKELLIFFSIVLIIGSILVLSNKGKNLMKKYILRKHSKKLKGFSKTLFYLLKEKKRYLLLNFLITAIKWTLTGLMIFILFYALGINLSFIYIFLITGSVKILSFLPISINGLGVDESISIFLYSLFNVPAASVLIVYLFSRVINYFLASLLIIFKDNLLKT